MKEQVQKERRIIARAQYRDFMKIYADYIDDPLAKTWAEKQASRGTPLPVHKIDFMDKTSFGYGIRYTRHIHKLLAISFELTFQAGLREMCNTEVLCFLSLAKSKKSIQESPDCFYCEPIFEEDILKKNDPYLWQVWGVAEKMGLEGVQFVVKSQLESKGKKNMEEMAECAAGIMNPLIFIAINAKESIDKKD
jgi:hypothetical protein